MAEVNVRYVLSGSGVPFWIAHENPNTVQGLSGFLLGISRPKPNASDAGYRHRKVLLADRNGVLSHAQKRSCDAAVLFFKFDDADCILRFLRHPTARKRLHG